MGLPGVLGAADCGAGAAVGTVVDKEKFDLDTPIVNYLPEFMASDPYMTRYLTERDLLVS